MSENADACEAAVKAALAVLVDAFARDSHLLARFALASLFPMRHVLIGRPRPEAPTVDRAAYLCAVGLKAAGVGFELSGDDSDPLDEALRVLGSGLALQERLESCEWATRLRQDVTQSIADKYGWPTVRVQILENVSHASALHRAQIDTAWKEFEQRQIRDELEKYRKLRDTMLQGSAQVLPDLGSFVMASGITSILYGDGGRATIVGDKVVIVPK